MDYSEAYFNWQKEIGKFGGQANLFKFSGYISPEDVVIDFGCGGGYLLKNIVCARKIGIEISDVAREQAALAGIEVYKVADEIPDETANIIISNHALEHVEYPIDIVRNLYSKLKINGLVVFVVPHDKPNQPYREDDINQHLHTWNPQTLGNLFKAAGYTQIQVDTIRHQWPPRYRKIHKLFGQRYFDLICKITALYRNNYQIRVVAKKAK